MSKAADVTGADFEEKVLKSPVPVLVDFWGYACPGCDLVAPHVDAVAEQFEGRARVFKVNTSEEMDLAVEYGIFSIPALLFFKEGEVVDQLLGAVPQAQLAAKLQSLLD